MCQFYSCIITQKGKIYDKLGVDSHTRLEEIYGLRDNGLHERAKLEVVPKELRDPVDMWDFIVDEERTPEWWNDGYKGIVLEHLKKQVVPKHLKKTKNGYKVYGWYENGKKWWEWNYVNGQKHGKQYGWYENGKKRWQDNYVNGQKHGKQCEWYENGNKRWQENYVNGQLV